VGFENNIAPSSFFLKLYANYSNTGTAEVTCSLVGVSPNSDFNCTELTCADIGDCGEHASCDEGNSGDGFMCLCDDGCVFDPHSYCLEIKYENCFTGTPGTLPMQKLHVLRTRATHLRSR